MRRLAFMLLLCAGVACAQDGVDVGEASSLRTMVPAEQMEQQAAKSYRQLLKQAAAKEALAPDSHPELKRLRAIAKRLLPHAERFNPRAAQWHWEVNLIGSKQINAFCMPGGKIAFYTGILNTLKLTDDERAVACADERGAECTGTECSGEPEEELTASNVLLHGHDLLKEQELRGGADGEATEDREVEGAHRLPFGPGGQPPEHLQLLRIRIA